MGGVTKYVLFFVLTILHKYGGYDLHRYQTSSENSMMGKERVSYTTEEKLKIIKYAETKGN